MADTNAKTGIDVKEVVDRVVTYGTPAFLVIKELLQKLATNPKVQELATEALLKVAKGGRTRTDELIFFASLTSLSGPDASQENKLLFYQKFYELTNPDLSGKTPDEVKEFLRKRDLAKGLIFLIAEDTTANDQGAKKFSYAKQVWYGLFLGIKELPDDNAKLQELEKRILMFGKNHQEGLMLPEIAGKAREFISTFNNNLGAWAGQINTYAGTLPKHNGYLRGIFGNQIGGFLERILTP